MKILFLNTPLIFKLIPRNYNFDISDVILKLRNETTDVEIIPIITCVKNEFLEITIETQPSDFKIQNTYQISVLENDNILYLGKLKILKQGTNTQNYQQQTQNDKYFKFK